MGEISYALQFGFNTSNDEAEYEALLIGLRMTKQMGEESIVAVKDSRLATNQINGGFEENDKQMKKYVKAVQHHVEPLKEFTIKQIPRGENRRADTLSKLASMCFDHLSKKVLVEVLKERSIDE